MKQHSIFNEQIIIPGLQYRSEYISSEQEKELLELIDNMPWNSELKRRTQHYGYKYDYTSKSINLSHYLGKMPDWLDALCNTLYTEGIFEEKPDQVIVNEYMPGQGIVAHIDCIPCFSDTICSLSLASSCIMDWTYNKIKHSTLIENRSLLVLKNDAKIQMEAWDCA